MKVISSISQIDRPIKQRVHSSQWQADDQYLNVVFNSIGIYDAISGISFQTVKTLDSTLSAL